jgi:hypothetical protein
VVGNQRYNIGFIIDDQYALGYSARFSHVLKLWATSSPRQPTMCHEHLGEVLQRLFDTIAPDFEECGELA